MESTREICKYPLGCAFADSALLNVATVLRKKSVLGGFELATSGFALLHSGQDPQIM